MSATETKDACKRELTVEVPADVVARETQAVVEKFQKMARLPGFRRGKAPASIIQQRFAEDIKSEVLDTLLPRFFQQAAEQQGLKPVSRPRVSDLESRQGEPLRFKATFEVLPEIDVGTYQEIRAEKPAVSVGEEEIQQALKNLQEQNASYNPVEDRALADGDFAQISFTGTPKEEGGKPVNVDDVMVEIGGSNTVRDFSENLRGATPGEERAFDVAYAEDFSDERLRGKTVTYAVKVKAIKQKAVPELNDEFAKLFGEEFSTLETLKQRIGENLEHDKRHAAEHEAKEKLMEELVRRHDFPVPEALVEHQIDVRLERGLRALAAQGMRAEDMKKMDLQRLRAGQRESAEREVKVSLILEKIAEAERIEVSDAEVNQEVEALAKQTNQTVDAIRARLTRDGALERIRSRIRNDKALDYLYSKSA